MSQHILGIKDEQLAEPVGNGPAAGLLYNLGKIFGRYAHLIGIITHQMLTGMVVYGQFHELFQHLTLTCGSHRLFHILTAL